MSITDNTKLVADLRNMNIEVITEKQLLQVDPDELVKSGIDDENKDCSGAFKIKTSTGEFAYAMYIETPSGATYSPFAAPIRLEVESIVDYCDYIVEEYF